MKRIILCGEFYSSNFGDGIIVDSSKYILEQISEDYIIDIMDFSSRKNFAEGQKKLEYKDSDSYRTMIKLALRLRGISTCLNIVKWFFKKRKVYQNYYSEKLKDADMIIFSGGHILMNNSLEYPLRLSMINKIAENKNISIVFNSCGSEKTKSVLGKRILKNVLVSKNVKVISVRDNVENIEYLAGTGIKDVKDVYVSDDPATIIASAYNIEKKESNTIGIGVISNLAYVNAYSRNKNDYLISEEYMLSRWIEIIKEIINKGYKCKIFSNGGYHDNSMSYKLQAMLDDNIEVCIPKNAYELVNEISNYKGVIAHRLHANILAYSLKIPSVGLVWDDKLVEFGNRTARKKFFINLKEHEVNSVVSLLEEAMSEGIDEEIHTTIIRDVMYDFKRKIEKASFVNRE